MTEEMEAKDAIKGGLPTEVAYQMLRVILAFARLDTSLSAWLIQAYGMPLYKGAMLVENMDAGNKINRLKKLYANAGDEKSVGALGRLKKEFEKNREVRNTIAHATYVGVMRSKPHVAVFSPARASDEAGRLELVCITIEKMDRSAAWALRSAAAVISIYERLEGQIVTLDE